MGNFRNKLEAGGFVLTGEVSPPRGRNIDKMLKSAKTFSVICDAVNITDNQGATLHLSSLAASKLVLECGIEPVFQQTCRDRNRLALQSDLLAAATYGLENILVVTGDNLRAGDHPQAKPVFDLDSTQLVAVVDKLNHGFDMNGTPLEGEPTSFYIGAAAFPEAEPWELQKRRIAQKIDEGVRFFQTQAIMDIEVYAPRIAEIQTMGAKVIAGIILLKSERVIRFINNNLGGAMVPASSAQRITSAKDQLAEAAELALEQAIAMREIADGIHIMPLKEDDLAVDILRRAGFSDRNDKEQ